MEERRPSAYPLGSIEPAADSIRRVFVVRHADASKADEASEADEDEAPECDADDDGGRHLTEIGRLQAEALGRRAAGWQLDAIFCSDLHRSRETAKAIGDHHPAVPFIVDQLFREVSAGTVEEQLDAPDGKLRARLEAVWQKVITIPYQVSVIIAHNGLIKYLIGRTIKFNERLKPRFHSAYTGISGLAVKPGRSAHLQFFNDVSHLTTDIVDGPKRPWIEDVTTGRWHF